MTTFNKISFYIVITILLFETNLYSEEQQTLQSDHQTIIAKNNISKTDTIKPSGNSAMVNDSITIDTSKNQQKHPTYCDIRGLEEKKKKCGDGFRRVSSGILYPFRQVINGLFLIAGKSAALALDDEFRSKVENLIYFYEENETKAGWFPLVAYSSGPRFRLGAALFFRNELINTNVKAYWGGKDYWSTSYHLSYKYTLGLTEWEPTIEAQWVQKDEFEFYGIGPEPKDDMRSSFLSGTNESSGVFTQERRSVLIQLPVRFFDHWHTHYLFLYQMRKMKSGGHDGTPIGEVFDLAALSGGDFNQPVEQIYNEIDLAYDSRDYKKIYSPGWKIEGYTGISNGIGKDNSVFARAGGEISAFLPVIKRNRLLVPKVALDMTKNLNDDVDIPFIEYSRHHSFRGISSKKIIRSDNWSVMPSLEYQWPLNHFMAGHIFVDYLVVGPYVKEIGWQDGLYVGGIGIDLHSKSKEMGRILFGYGSEGFRVSISLGLPSHSNSRKDWQ